MHTGFVSFWEVAEAGLNWNGHCAVHHRRTLFCTPDVMTTVQCSFRVTLPFKGIANASVDSHTVCDREQCHGVSSSPEFLRAGIVSACDAQPNSLDGRRMACQPVPTDADDCAVELAEDVIDCNAHCSSSSSSSSSSGSVRLFRNPDVKSAVQSAADVHRIANASGAIDVTATSSNSGIE
jgi:hypothetical protein